MSDQIKYATEYALVRFGIEKNQFQAFFATQSAREALELDVNLPVVAVNQTANKSLRISSLEPDFSNGLLLLPQHGCDDLKDEISYWSPDGKDDDDGLDSLEGARTLARAWESVQNTSIVQGSIHTFLAERPAQDSDDPYAEWEAIADKKEEAEEEKEPEECQPESLPFILIGQEHSLSRQG